MIAKRRIRLFLVVGAYSLFASITIDATEKEAKGAEVNAQDLIDLLGWKVSKFVLPKTKEVDSSCEFVIERWRGNKLISEEKMASLGYRESDGLLIKFPTQAAPTWMLTTEANSVRSDKPMLLTDNGAIAWHMRGGHNLDHGENQLAIRTDGNTDYLRGSLKEIKKQLASKEHVEYIVFKVLLD